MSVITQLMKLSEYMYQGGAMVQQVLIQLSSFLAIYEELSR